KIFYHYKKTLAEGSLSYDKIRSIYEDSYENLWIGTEGGGINFLPAADSISNSYQDFSNDPRLPYTFALSEYSCKKGKYLLMGGQMRPGLYQTEIKEGMQSLDNIELTSYPEIRSSVFAILNVDDCDIWVGTYNSGLYILDAENQKLGKQHLHRPDDPASLSSDLIRSLMRDKEGNIWIGTGHGLNRLNAEDVDHPQPTFVSYLHDANDPNSISHNYILALYQAKSGDIWIGTLGGGLNKFVQARKGEAAHFVSYTEADGLPNNVVKGILEDEEGFLWISTNNGLSRFNPETGIFYNFDARDGLQSDEFSELAQLKRKNGDMIFGGVNGFNVFKTSSIHRNPEPPQLAITEFQILNKTVKAGETFNDRILLKESIAHTSEIELKHHENSFSLGFTAFHYRAPLNNRYAFRLEGFHEDWVEVGADKRFVNFTNLDPGTYTFKLKASNSDGVWTETPAQISIHIAPAFWMTWWAFLLYAIILAGLIWLLAHYTFIGIREKHQLMFEHLEKEKKEELQQLKLRFFTNISHELRTPLSLISGPIDYLIQAGKDLNHEIREKQYQLIRKNSDYLLRLANQLLDFRKVEEGIVKLKLVEEDVLPYIKEASEPFQFLAEKKDINFSIVSSADQIITYYDREVVEKVINNLLSNAFRHTPKEGKVLLEVESLKQGNADFLEIRVRDSGKGVDKKDREKIFYRFFKGEKNLPGPSIGIGLSYCKELVKLHRGKIWVEENKPQGACFVLQLPSNSVAYTQEEKHSLVLEEKKPAKRFKASMEVEERTFSENVESYPQAREEYIISYKADYKLPTLLLVDDNPDIRSFLHEAFQSEYRILQAENGKIATEIAFKQNPCLIISDVMMPEM
ncbi:MAG: two-component regulator propeller domain-containing protein, partial [Bacteroidota bacterium]